MKSLLFRATAPAVTLASCLCMFGGVASAQTASITDSGRDSNNEISFKNLCKLDVSNDTDVNLTNTTFQTAVSGSATVHGNDDVGTVATGSASNSNTSNFGVTVKNTTGSCLPATSEQQQGGQTGGQGGGQTGGQGGMGGGEVSTPVVASTSSVVTSTGGRGGEVASTVPAAQQVAVVPTGGVGAGDGTPAYLAGLTAVTMGSSVLAARRLHKSYKSQA